MKNIFNQFPKKKFSLLRRISRYLGVLVFVFLYTTNQVSASHVLPFDTSSVSNTYDNFLNKISENKKEITKPLNTQSATNTTTINDYKKYISWQAKNLSEIMQNSFANYYDAYTSGLAQVLYPAVEKNTPPHSLTSKSTPQEGNKISPARQDLAMTASVIDSYKNFLNSIPPVLNIPKTKSSETKSKVSKTVSKTKNSQKQNSEGASSSATFENYKNYVISQGKNLSKTMQKSWADYYDAYTSGLAQVLYPSFDSSSPMKGRTGGGVTTRATSSPSERRLGGEVNVTQPHPTPNQSKLGTGLALSQGEGTNTKIIYIQGPQGPQGPKGDKGDKGEPGLQSIVTNSVNPVAYMPVGITIPNPSQNFTGGEYASIANFTSNLFTNNISNITTLNVSGNSTLTGNLTVAGTASIPTVTITNGTIDNLTVTGSGNSSFAGNLGIGTTAPLNKLHVQGTPSGAAGIYLNDAVPGTTTNTLYNDAGALMWNGSAVGGGGGGSGTVNTGVAGYFSYYPSNGTTVDDQTVLYTNGTNVGIGTASPGSTLDVGGTIRATSFATPSSGAGLELLYNSASNGGTSSIYSIDRTAVAYKNLNLNDKAYITAGGNIGVGTTNPAEKLQIITGNILLSNQYALRSLTSGGGNTALIGLDSGDYNTIYSPGNGIKFKSVTSTDLVTILNGGNIGIGSATPGYKLDVAGSTNLSTGNAYYINGASVLNGNTLGSGVTASSLTSVGTITSGTWSGSFGAISGANLTSLTAGNLTGTIPSAVLGNSTMYIGTTAHALNRSSASEGLAGITSLTPGANFTLSQNSVNVLTSEETGAVVNTLYLKTGNVGVGTTSPGAKLEVNGTSIFKGDLSVTSGNVVTIGALSSPPGSPQNGQIFYDSTANKFKIVESGTVKTLCNGTDQSCGTGTSSSWSGISDPTGNLALNMNSNTTTFTWGNATGASNLLNINDSSSNSGTGILLNVATGTGSTVNPLSIKAGTTNAIFVNSSGNVGIGTTSPSQLLTVGNNNQFTVDSSGNISIGSGTTNFTKTSGTLQMSLPTGNLSINAGGYLSTFNGVNGDFTTPGNVGIGTTGPDAPLGFGGTTGAKINLFDGFNYDIGVQSNQFQFIVPGTGNRFSFGSGTSGSFTEWMSIKDGNVGIGTTGPGAKLDVNGTSVFHGTNSNSISSQVSAVEFTVGRSGNGGLNAGQSDADIAFQYGGSGGGFRHFISTKHNTAADSGNGIEFFVNTSATAGGSSAPGTGNVRVMGLYGNGNVGIGTTGPGARLEIGGTQDGGASADVYGLKVNQTLQQANLHDAYGTYLGGTINTGQYGTASNAYGAYVAALAKTGVPSITNAYGLRIATQTVGTNNYGLYVDGATSYFGGNVGIGTTGPGFPLQVGSGTITSINGATKLYVTGSSETRIGAGINNIGTFMGYNAGGYGYLFAYDYGGSTEKDLVFGSTEHMRITSDGNVGIGTTGPSLPLEVKGTGHIAQFNSTYNGGGSAGIHIIQSGNTASANKGRLLDFGFQESGGTILYPVAITALPESAGGSNSVATALTFSTGTNSSPTEWMRITSSGNVGIGTTNPGQKLTVSQSNSSTTMFGTNEDFALINSNGTNNTWSGMGFHGTGNGSIAAGLAAQYYDTTNSYATLNFFTRSANGWQNGLSINSGNVGIGTTTPGSKLDVNGTVTATAFSGPLTGNVTGNASTATALQTARTIGGVSFDGTANITVASATGGFTISGGDLALGANSLTMTGSLAATGARVTKGWFTDIESTNMPTVGGTSLSSTFAPIAGTMYIGTTAHALNRSSASEGLAGITSLTPGANFTLSQNSVNVLTSEETGAVVNTLYLKTGNVGIGTTNPGARLEVDSSGSDPQTGTIRFFHSGITSGQTTSILIGKDYTNSAYFGAGYNTDSSQNSAFIGFPGQVATLTILKTGDTTGNVGIGTTGPVALLTIGSGTPTTAANGLNFGTDTTANLYRSAAGTIKTDGAMVVTGALTVASCTGCGGSSSFSGFTAAAGTNSINNADYAQTWSWNTLSSNTGLALASTSTAAASNTQKLFSISLSGANSNATQTTYGSYITNTHTGTSSTNVAGYFSASGGTNNYAAIFESGNVGIGTTAPSTTLDIRGTYDGGNTLFLRDNSVNASTSSAKIGFDSGGTSVGFIRGVYNGGVGGLSLGYGASTDLINIRGGNVGIGTTGPGLPFEVQATGPYGKPAAGVSDSTTAWAYLLADNTSHNSLIWDSSRDFRFGPEISKGSGFAEKMRISSAGNLGIGTTNPGARLQVSAAAGGVADYISIQRGSTDWRIWASDSITSTSSMRIGGSSTSAYAWQFDWSGTNANIFRSPNNVASQITLAVRGATSQSANIFEIQDSNGTPLTVANASGNIGIGQTSPTSKLDITTAGLGVTQTTSSGLALVNTTAAAAGAQQISPAIRWSGFGWKTDATAASQAVDFRSYVVPVQGTANPSGYLSFGSSINGGAYNDGQMVLTSGGNVGIGTTGPSEKLHVNGGNLKVDGGYVYANGSGNGLYVQNTAVIRGNISNDQAAYLTISGGTSGYTYMSGNVGIGQTSPTSKLDITTAGLGVTQTTSSGLALVNTTAAAAGAQQISPAIRWSGFGWKTDATAASQAVDFRSYVVPVQGTANPSGYLSFGSSINGGAYNDGQMVLTSGGNVGIGSITPGSKLDVNGTVTATAFSGPLTGNVTGNASTATALQTARTIGGVSFDGTANITVASATGGFTVSGGDLALGANSLTMTGSLAATGARVTKGWFTDIESTNMPTVGGTSLSSTFAPIAGTMYIGTTAHALNRSSASEGLSGITSLTPGANFSLTQNSVNVLTSEETGAVVNTLYLKTGNVGIGTTNPVASLQIGSGYTTASYGKAYIISDTANGSIKDALNLIHLSDLSAGSGVGINFTLNSAATPSAAIAGVATGTSANTDLVFKTWNSTSASLTEKMRLNAFGNLGIGTTGPSVKLHVATDDAATNVVTDILQLNHSSSGTPAASFGTGLLFTGESTTTDARNMARIQSAWSTATDASRASLLQFQTLTGAGSLTTQMTIDGAGNVGIGTTNPGARLAVGLSTDTTAAAGMTIGGIGIYRNGSSELVLGGGVTVSNYLGTVNNLAVGGVLQQNGASGYSYFSSELQALANMTIGYSYSTNAPTSGLAVAGNVGIGTTSPGSILALGGTAARIFGMDRNSTAATAGQGLTISSGGAIAGTADLAGGDLTLKSGISTGTGSSAIHFYTATAGASATTDRTPTEKMTILGSGNVGIGTTNPGTQLSIMNSSGANISFGLRGHLSASGGAGEVSLGSNIGYLNDGWVRDDSGAVASMIYLYNGTIDLNVYGAGSGSSNVNNALHIDNGGNVGIGTASPGTLLEIGSKDLGNGAAGPVLTLGRNTNATNTGAGSINFMQKGGTAGYVWQDAAGNMRINTAAPSNANDTAGTVIGTQTSTRDTKQDITDYTDYTSALNSILNAPLHTFRYTKEVQGYGSDSPLAKPRIGFIADEVDGVFMWGNSIDQVSVNGLLMASIKELNLKINDLKDLSDVEKEGTLASLIRSYLENATNGLRKIFTGEVHSDKICVKKSNGDEVCINGDELDALISGANTNQSGSIINNTGGNQNNPAPAPAPEPTPNQSPSGDGTGQAPTPTTPEVTPNPTPDIPSTASTPPTDSSSTTPNQSAPPADGTGQASNP